MRNARECPPEETLAAFADGRLPARERSLVIRHLDQCQRCVELLGDIVRSVVIPSDDKPKP